MCDTENPQVKNELECLSPKVNVWCAVKHNRVFSSFFSSEDTVCLGPYSDMLEMYAAPQIQDSGLLTSAVFQHHGAPPQWIQEVYNVLNATSVDNWSGCRASIPCPPPPIPLISCQKTSPSSLQLATPLTAQTSPNNCGYICLKTCLTTNGRSLLTNTSSAVFVMVYGLSS